MKGIIKTLGQIILILAAIITIIIGVGELYKAPNLKIVSDGDYDWVDLYPYENLNYSFYIINEGDREGKVFILTLKEFLPSGNQMIKSEIITNKYYDVVIGPGEKYPINIFVIAPNSTITREFELVLLKDNLFFTKKKSDRLVVTWNYDGYKYNLENSKKLTERIIKQTEEIRELFNETYGNYGGE